MQLAELMEDLLLILPAVILVEGIIALVAWLWLGSKGSRGARVAAWIGLVTLTLWVGSAIAFVGRVADAAEGANHHPDILVHGWNRVRLTLSTHSAGGVTDADLAMAASCDALISG